MSESIENTRQAPMHAALSSRNRLSTEPVAPEVAYLTVLFVNAYFIGEPGGPWTLVDTGLPYAAPYVRRAAEIRYGPGARPQAIILTHGHFDHAGAAKDLAEAWDVPVYAHLLEMPYLTGRSDYAPQDPTIGGAISFLSRFFPHTGIDLGTRVQPLPADGSVPTLPGWQWIHTPGHTVGHISLFRASDRTLIAGDAFATTDLDSWASVAAETPELDRPPAPFTPDWAATRASIEYLSTLEPKVVAAGHGKPLTGNAVPDALRDLAAKIVPPPGARYSAQAPATDETGAVVGVPPPVPDPLPTRLALAAGAVGLFALAFTYERNKRSEKRFPDAL